MTYIPVTGGSAAAAAAARARRMRQEEEEKLTTYNKDDLSGWEFKIIRSATGKFKDYKTVQKVCQEEAQAGWELVEKFDNGRMRFKRRIEMRSKDQFLQFDAYRTTVGMGEGGLVLTVLGSIALAAGLVLLVVYLIRLNM